MTDEEEEVLCFLSSLVLKSHGYNVEPFYSEACKIVQMHISYYVTL